MIPEGLAGSQFSFNFTVRYRKKGEIIMAGLVPFDRGRGRGLSIFDPDFMRGFFGDMKGLGSFDVDVKDKGDHFEIKADLPGLHREMIDVDVNNGVMTISANKEEESHSEKDDYVINERRMGKVSRSFSIGDVKAQDIQAEYKDGVLSISIPKAGPKDESSGKVDIR
jgi:HSP20 family protein